ncbi:polysaccharide biosynthesis protein [Fictibacillus phosphorivorans]|uniref:polysaccharide biosynthesis protein n=1 Tax=Fictibacillus phosphorivorans TaxID=1221500 RepID=UPI002041B3D5|nr:polysaccharide biosynthesis protein [Fictibacillus phosphorivorans]MCM3719148.1 polysaccharide biosynthesis protein [Fictibacillus phosphorivorans]MCM3776770.1 polysaccharide biosynthesis protein [Fictibacillus phosphorivorans]
MFNSKILITGGTGSWGNELVKQLLEKNPKEIRIFSRNEASQVAMQRKFNNNEKIKFIIGDIRDKDAVLKASEQVDYIYHLAALKHVPICEYQPIETIKTNIIGTQFIIEASIQNKVKKVIYISTDKAANPSNFYGMTKAIGEKMIIHANLLGSDTKFVCVRGGNVLGTNGSVIHVFRDHIHKLGEIGITDYRMTRFFLTLEEAIHLLFKATEESLGGEIFVMKMPSCRIKDLAEVLIEDSGKKDIKIIEKGIRSGEKIDEILLTNYESQSTYHYDDQYFVILPTIDIKGLKEHYASYKKFELETYSSGDRLMSKEEIKQMLRKGGFIA